jgi:hypothetical protein
MQFVTQRADNYPSSGLADAVSRSTEYLNDHQYGHEDGGAGRAPPVIGAIID